MILTTPRLACLMAMPLLTSAMVLELRQAQQKVTIDLTKKYQTMDGFGISGAFQRANLIVNLQQPKQREVLDLLFNTTTGAGFSIVRNGIGSTPNSNNDYMNTILPNCPSTPAEVTVNYSGYVWDGKDSGQLFLSQRAQEYGVNTFYADAWSAPGCMKTNNQDTNGGQLCGVRAPHTILLFCGILLTYHRSQAPTAAREIGNRPTQIISLHTFTSMPLPASR
jgi:O-glycosyl hydrolase